MERTISIEPRAVFLGAAPLFALFAPLLLITAPTARLR